MHREISCLNGKQKRTQQTIITGVKKREYRGPQKVENMEDHRRTRSQGPPSLPEGTELIQWDSLEDPVRIERENAEAHRLARETNTVIDVNERTAENSEISQVTNTQPRYTAKAP